MNTVLEEQTGLGISPQNRDK